MRFLRAKEYGTSFGDDKNRNYEGESGKRHPLFQRGVLKYRRAEHHLLYFRHIHGGLLRRSKIIHRIIYDSCADSTNISFWI